MADLSAIQAVVATGEYQYTLHALRRTIERHITRMEVEQAIARAKIIEDYPEDKYSPSCLLYGNTDNGRALHIQISYPPSSKIITLYEPDPNEWENNEVRKST